MKTFMNYDAFSHSFDKWTATKGEGWFHTPHKNGFCSLFCSWQRNIILTGEQV